MTNRVLIFAIYQFKNILYKYEFVQYYKQMQVIKVQNKSNERSIFYTKSHKPIVCVQDASCSMRRYVIKTIGT